MPIDIDQTLKVVVIGIAFAEKLFALAKKHGTAEDAAELERALTAARDDNARRIARREAERNAIEGGAGTND